MTTDDETEGERCIHGNFEDEHCCECDSSLGYLCGHEGYDWDYEYNEVIMP